MNFKVLEQEIQRLYEETPENICGVGYGQKSVAGSLTSNESIVFHVYKKVPRAELNEDDVIPEKIVIDGKEYLTDVIETPPGCLKAYDDCYNPLNESDIEILRLRGQSSAGVLLPLRGGQQIFTFPDLSATGTLGFFAIDNEDGKVVGVTNTHVAMNPVWYSKDVVRPLGGRNGELFNTTNTIEPRYSSFDEKKYPIGSAVRSLYDFYIAAEHVKRFIPLRSDGQRNIESEGGNFVTDKKKNYVDAALLIMSRENFADTNTPIVGPTSYGIHGPISADSASPAHYPFATTEELEYFFTEAANGTKRNVYATGGRSGPKGYCPNKRLNIYLSGVTTSPIEYSGDDATFTDAFYIRGAGDGTTIPADNIPGRPGDSGSGVLADVIEITHATVTGNIVGGQNTITNAIGSQVVDDVAIFGINLNEWIGAKVQITSNTTGITLVQNTTIQSVSGAFDASNPAAPRTITLSNSFTGTGNLTNVSFELTKYSSAPTRKIIGLFFAGGEIEGVATGIACRIDHVANALNIRAWTSNYAFDQYHSLSKSVPIVLRSSDFASTDPTVPPPDNISSDLYQLRDENGVAKKYWHSGCTLQNYYSASGPTDVVLDTTKILHNNALGDVVGQFSVVDPDTTRGVIDVYQYTLAPGGTNNSEFRITANLLRANAVFTTGTTKNIRVAATDTRGRSFSKSFSLNVVGQEEITPGTPSGTPGNGQVVLNWSAPVLPGSISPMYYVVEHSADDFVTSYTQVVSGAPPVPPPTTCIVGALKNGTAYKFTVRASLSDGRMTAASAISSAIVPATVPDAPINFFVAPYAAGTIHLSWAPPLNDGGSPVTDYSVEYNEGSPPNKQTWTLYSDAVSPSTGCFVSGLDATQAYFFRVRSKNAVGFSLNWAESAPAVSPPAVANAPTNLSITAVGNAQVSLSWTAPTNVSASSIQYYVIQYKLASDTSDNWFTFAGANSATTTRTITGLTNSLTYVFRVRAQTAFEGIWSDASTSATPEAAAPGAPASISPTAGDSQVTVAWTPPTDNGGAAITEYKVEYSSDNSSWSEFTTGAPFSASPVNVTGLINGTTYWFRVSAKNYTPNFGPPRATTNSVTPFGIPGAVTDLTAANFANKQATLTWTAPTSTNGKALTKYVVQYRVNVLPESWSTFNNTSTPLATYAAITGLTNGTSYVARVYAENNPGSQSLATTSAAFSPPLLVPQTAPKNLTISVGNEEATANWTPWDDTDLTLDNGGSSVTGYIAGHKLSSGSTWTNSAALASDAASYVITGLQNGETYDFRLAAINAQGTSAAYALANGVTVAQGAPNPPLNVTGTPAGSGEISVTWDAPVSNGGAVITSYTIEYTSDNTNWFFATTTTDTSSRTFTIALLNNGTPYQFRVKATNSFGTSSPSVVSSPVTPRTTPAAPTDLTATEAAGSVSLTWVAPTDNGGAALSGYVVEHKTSTDSTWTATNISNATTLSYVVQSLDNGVAYDFRVAATNAAGTGTPSSSVSATPRTTPAAPTGLSGTSGDTQVDLSWNAPSDDGGSPITGYVVRYKEFGPLVTNWTDLNINDGSTLNTTVTGLTNDTIYLFKVAATNVAGTGPDTAEIYVTPEIPASPAPGKPTITSVVIAPAQATVSWNAPSYAGSSSIIGYEVSYFNNDTSVWEDYYDSVNETYTITGTTVIITGLNNGTQYKFRVRAVNNSGAGDWSNESGYYTPVDAPSAPQSFTGSAGNAQINLSWTAPASTNGAAIDKYKIEYSDDDGDTWQLFSATLPATLLYASVTLLTNGTPYLFKVYAHNSVGWSAETVSSSYTPSAIYPLAPTGLTATAGDAEVTLSWTAPSNIGTDSTAINYYTVEVSNDNQVTWSEYAYPATTTYLATFLTNGATYWFRVNAVNDNFYPGNFSAAVEATPTGGA